MNQYNILLVGAGELGSRYLQGLKSVDVKIKIYVSEPNLDNRMLAQKRFDEIPDNNNVKGILFIDDIDLIDDDIDLAIVATSSQVRFSLTKRLINETKVKFLILEKVLFQKVNEYDIISSLLVKNNVKCWVNHTRRVYPFYNTVKKSIKDKSQICFTAQGGGWGLACNALHFIDLFSFLSGSQDLIINTSLIENKVYKSKRDDFIEFNGSIVGMIGQNQFFINSFDKHVPIVISIMSEDYLYIIDEDFERFEIRKKDDNWIGNSFSEKIVYFQSEITHIIIQEILVNGDSSLPSYSESANHHKIFISSLLKKYNNILGTDNYSMPIT